MAQEIEKLVVALAADIKSYENGMRRAVGVMNAQARQIEQRAARMGTSLDRIGQRAAHAISGPLAGIGAAFSVREVARYADAWTLASNKIAAASQTSGIAARSLEGIREIADASRSGLTETADLYARLMRSAVGSEAEIARATEIVGKSFAASGATAQEAAAGVLQLGQALGSGVVQGDELRSILENAPLLGQAIADGMGVGIGQLKALGAEGKITSDIVFAAILAAGPKIGAAFDKTNRTIASGLTLVENAMTQYVGQSDASLGATSRLTTSLGLLADNFGTVADAVLSFAGLVAGALIGRSIARMAGALTLAAGAMVRFVAAARAATSVASLAVATGGLAAAAAPLGAILGIAAAGALSLYAGRAIDAADRTDELRAEFVEMGLIVPPTTDKIDTMGAAIDSLANPERIRRIAALREEWAALNEQGLMNRLAPTGDSIPSLGREAAQPRGILSPYEERDDAGRKELAEVLRLLGEGKLAAADVLATIDRIGNTDISAPFVDLLERGREAVAMYGALERAQLAAETGPGFDEARADIDALLATLSQLPNASANGLDGHIARVLEAAAAHREGTKTAEETRAALAQIAADEPRLAGYVAALSPLFVALDALRARAAATRAELSSVAAAYPPDMNRFGNPYDKPSPQAPATSPRPRRIPNDVDAGMPPLPTGGGGGGGGGGGSQAKTDYADAVASVREATEAHRLEAAELDRAALSMEAYGSVAEYAQQRMELLVAAQREGRAVTPELAAEIDALARQYVEAAAGADDARERHERFEAAVADSRSTLEGIFSGLTSGALNFKDALGQVIGKLAEMLSASAFETLWGGLGLGKRVGQGLEATGLYASGGYTGPGPRKKAAGVVHKGEVVWSQDDVARAGGVGVVEAMRRGAPGFAMGGPVAQTAMPSPRSMARPARLPHQTVDVTVSSSVDREGNIRTFVEGVAVRVTEQSIRHYDRQMPKRVDQISRDPRRR